jgi:hypothetical protein
MEATPMTLQEFWANVRSAGGFLLRRAAVDSPRLDANRIERVLRRSRKWLTPKAVAGFDPDDFAFLSEEERRDLQESVNRFLQVVEQAPESGQPSEAQVEAALLPFKQIVEILRPDKYADRDALVSGKKIEQYLRGRLPDWVRELVFETGNDSTLGEPAIFIWVEIADEAAEDDVFSENTRLAWDIVDEAARKVDPERWPFNRFRSSSEQRAAKR